MAIPKCLTYACFLSTLAMCSVVEADVKLPAIIGDNMVLQAGQTVPLYGTAAPGEEVTVTIGDQSRQTTADSDGRWIVKFDDLQADGPVEAGIVGNNEITLKNVLIGEVWICSGQSNMVWTVSNSNNPDTEIAAAKHPTIRLFQAKKVVSGEPQSDTEGSWKECSPETIPSFSAVGYFFGRELQETINRPVGLIQTAWGGTPAESWTSRKMLESDKDLKVILDRWNKILSEYPQRKQKYDEKVAEWKLAVEKAKAAGENAPRKPRAPLGPDHPHRAASLYNGMIAPLAPFAIKGAIWYQGESNAGRAYQYRKLFPAMIQDWRNTWKQGNFPFLFVQLANFMGRSDLPEESAWAELREAQSKTLALPNTGQAVIIDLGEARDIHPRNKQDVGYRLALSAASVAYDLEKIHSGPVFRSMQPRGPVIQLKFDHVGHGLKAYGGQELKGFAVAGEDRQFVWAYARIVDDSVIVFSDQVLNPVAVRYGWANNPECNLYNEEGLPASPFRTDDWPGVTVNNK